ncbi:ANTAR domain-containing protein [uncultured Jatrophihabitans sp.]|uniref:ANTAR domain-containing protein n=1 Tax=uncultured Jatrophihabitans sp. TaxID=1610747 RepID=UPI0035CBBFC1
MTISRQTDAEVDERADLQLARTAELGDGDQSEREIIANLQDRLIQSEMAYAHLEGAIASSRRIGAAIGIVMAVSKVTEEAALGVLKTISQRQNRKLRLVADDIVLTGTF